MEIKASRALQSLEKKIFFWDFFVFSKQVLFKRLKQHH